MTCASSVYFLVFSLPPLRFPLIRHSWLIVIGHKMVSLRTFCWSRSHLWQASPGLTLPSVLLWRAPCSASSHFCPDITHFCNFILFPNFLSSLCFACSYLHLLLFGPVSSIFSAFLGFCELHLISDSFIRTPRRLWCVFLNSISFSLAFAPPTLNFPQVFLISFIDSVSTKHADKVNGSSHTWQLPQINLNFLWLARISYD